MGVLLKHFDVMLAVHADALATTITVCLSAILFGLCLFTGLENNLQYQVLGKSFLCE